MIEETQEIRLKRLRMRSWRRGMKEMDLILGGYADAKLSGLAPEIIADYEHLLEECDQDLYKWVSGAAPAPERHGEMIRLIAAFHELSK